jgi:putative transposase
MVRAGVVSHPVEWAHSGYPEIHEPPKRYEIIDLQGLAALCGFTNPRDFQKAHRQWVEQALGNGGAPRDDRWSEAIAVGSLSFVERIKSNLGIKAMHREVLETNGTYALHEPSEAYIRNLTGEKEVLRSENSENTLPWNESLENPGR